MLKRPFIVCVFVEFMSKCSLAVGFPIVTNVFTLLSHVYLPRANSHLVFSKVS